MHRCLSKLADKSEQEGSNHYKRLRMELEKDDEDWREIARKASATTVDQPQNIQNPRTPFIYMLASQNWIGTQYN